MEIILFLLERFYTSFKDNCIGTVFLKFVQIYKAELHLKLQG